MSEILQANFTGKLKIGDTELPCFVLSDERRVISGRGITRAIGMKGRGQGMARITSHSALKPFINNELALAIASPIQFKVGGLKTSGYEATLLHSLCEVILQARDGGTLKTDYERRYAAAADAMIRSFAKVGIIALVDEATGYQEARKKDALARLLSVYLTEERLKWAKRFPDVFYKEIYRLNRWSWPPQHSSKRPGIVGQYTNDIVYERLPKGVLEKLKELNPVDEVSKRRRYRHHQFLSENIGQPDLQAHLLQVIALMRASGTWHDFLKLLDRAFPKEKGYQLDLIMDAK